MWNLRDASVNDLSAVVDGNAAMAEETEGRTLDRETLRRGCEAVLNDPALGRYIIASSEDGEYAGQLMLTYEWSDWRAGMFWWIQSVFVAPAHRRKGVYRALYEYVQQQAAAAENVCGIRLYVYETNERAKRTYKALGMDACGYEVFETEL
ncbi:MAG: GNAT family N-acetyltransferase [Myxococcota bacterium]